MRYPALLAAFFSFLLFPAVAHSQELNWYPRYSLSVFFNYSQIVDENVKNVSFASPGGGASLRRIFDEEHFYHYAEVSGYVLSPKAASEKSPCSLMINAAFKYGINFKHPFITDRVSLGLFALGSVREAFYKHFRGNNMYWANYFGLGGNLTVNQPVSESLALQAVIDLPLVGMDYRPGWKRKPGRKNTIKNLMTDNFSSSHFTSLGDYLNPSIALSVLTSRWPLLHAVSYRYTYVKAKTPASGEYRENAHALAVTLKVFN